MVSCTYASWKAKRPCASCTSIRASPDFINMRGYERLPWRTEATQAARLNAMRAGDRQISKEYSQHPIEVSGWCSIIIALCINP